MPSVKDLVGTWAPLIECEFYKPYMKEIQAKSNIRKKNIFEKYYCDAPIFKQFLITPLQKLKVVFIVDNPKFNDVYLRDIEKDLFNGLNINLSVHEDYEWLHQQGIMFFPREFSWGSTKHHEWHTFTDNVLLAVKDKPVLIVTNKSDIISMLESMQYNGQIMSELGPNLWKKVDTWVKDNYKQETIWSPSI